MDPSAIVIFLWLEQGVYEMNFLEEHVIWLVAPESITHEFGEILFETLAIQEEEDIPEKANKYVPAVVGFSSDPKKFFSLSISSLFNSEIEFYGFSSLLG